MRPVTQRLSLIIQNDLCGGNVSIKNFSCLCGEPYKSGDTLTIIPRENINEISIPPHQSAELSMCGSAAFKVAVKGTLDLYGGDTERVASLSWNGPWSLAGNELLVHDLNEDKFVVEVSSPPTKGILGDILVVVKDRSTAKNLSVISCATADMFT
ncbi:uncharacterized protein N7469_006168 [Penicillium citrinum]|uniref:Uncharacterized protein n=1 Tax=Penicillium citrinum TaxID=5077 RepID=A0A9W9TM64_PENCI|nr:uncharacterized protein N7469_006168 [Penicillium citrinum]KAJ5231580.1 hypothetical protein N7469_006168 [Penicillium citrinum]